MDNPYLEEFEQLQEKSGFRGQTWFGDRKALVEEYSWAVPTREAIQYISAFDDIIYEFGAGCGYWTRLCQEHGAEVEPIDNDPPDETWTDIIKVDSHAYFDEVENSVVLMVWPPYGEGMAVRVVEQKPAHVLYVGEQRGGCTASDKFFDLVEQEYGLVGKIDLPSYKVVNDDFYHYVRKT